MEKNKMKITGVVIMIMIRVSFSLGDYNHPFDQIGPNHVSDKLKCVDLCKIECAPLLIPPGGGLLYIYCVKKCVAGCGLSRSIDARHIATNGAGSCVQRCQNK
ncbi:hypothetical protein JHK86_056084 [Glycine max]|nr:hypothetical protein JHK86_056084 [Glycine max]